MQEVKIENRERHLAGSCRVNVDEGVGGWAESTGGHIDGQQHQQGFI